MLGCSRCPAHADPQRSRLSGGRRSGGGGGTTRRHVTSPLLAVRDCAVPFAYLTRCHVAAGGFRHLVSKRAWGLLAFEGPTVPYACLCLRCALGAEQERKFCQQVVTAAHDLSASFAYTRRPGLDSCMKVLVVFIWSLTSLTKRVKPQSWSLLLATANAAPASTA